MLSTPHRALIVTKYFIDFLRRSTMDRMLNTVLRECNDITGRDSAGHCSNETP